MESRSIISTGYEASLFSLRNERDETLITFPKNIESFADNLLMLSLLRLSILKEWKVQLSTTDLDTKVFDTPEGSFVAGFIAAAGTNKTGPRITGNTRFSKGVSAYQSFSVEKKYGKLPWLRTGGMDSLMQRLSVMKGFTKDYWGMRGTLAALLKMTPPNEVTDLETFMLPKQEILKTVRTKLPYENGGLFRTEEIAALNSRYSNVKELLTGFVMKLDNPSPEFAKEFMKEYTPVKTAVETVDREIKLLSVARSRLLFPEGKKKKDLNFKKKSLDEKIHILVEQNKESNFLPESLPGISKDATNNKEIGCYEWKKGCYSSYAKFPVAKDVIDSWYSIFHPETDESD